MAALWADQRQKNRFADHLDIVLPPSLCEKVRHYAESRNYDARQALSLIVSKFFGSCSK